MLRLQCGTMRCRYIPCSSFNTGNIGIQLQRSVRKQVLTAHILCSLTLALKSTVQI